MREIRKQLKKLIDDRNKLSTDGRASYNTFMRKLLKIDYEIIALTTELLTKMDEDDGRCNR